MAFPIYIQFSKVYLIAFLNNLIYSLKFKSNEKEQFGYFFMVF
jgi:hypothetical protein